MIFRHVIAGAMLLFLFCGTLPQSAEAATLIELSVQLQNLQQTLKNLQTSLFSHPASAQMTAGVGTVLTVSTDQQLLNAIVNSTGGEVIQLSPGTYSFMYIIGGTYNQVIVGTARQAGGAPTLSAAVTITSQDPANQAVMKGVDIKENGHWHFKKVSLRPAPSSGSVGGSFAASLSGADNWIEDSTITYGDATGYTATNWVNNVSNGVSITGANGMIRNNTFKNVYRGIVVNSNSPGTQVVHNTLDGIGGDGMDILSSNTIVESNLMKNFKAIDGNHTDCVQSWASSADGSIDVDQFISGVTIQNNICNVNENPSDPFYNTEIQGYTNFDGGTKNWLVQNNVFIGTAYHGFAYSGAVDNIFRNNTALDADPLTNGADAVWMMVSDNRTGTIKATGNTYQNNIANKYIAYGLLPTVLNSQTLKYADYNKVFRDWLHGDVRLLPTSLLQGGGANLDPATVGSGVTIAPPITAAATVTISTNVTNTTTGSSALLTWNSANVTACTASGDWSGTKLLSGSESTGGFTSAGTKSYNLYCTGAGSSVAKSVSIAVTDPAVVSQPISTSTFKVGDRVMMNKNVNVRSTTLIDPSTLIGVNTYGSQGVLVGGPIVSSDRFGVITWFSVNFDSGFDGWVGADNYVLVPAVTALPTVTLSASPASVLIGSGSTLTWSSTNATACTASGDWSGTKALGGSESAGLAGTVGTSTYLMTCAGPSGSVAKSVTVRAVATTTIASATTTLRVTTASNVNVRITPNGTKNGVQAQGAVGTLGTQASVGTAGHTWVYVDFDTGVDGWVARRYLIRTPQLLSATATVDVQESIERLQAQLQGLQQLLSQLIVR